MMASWNTEAGNNQKEGNSLRVAFLFFFKQLKYI